LKISWMKAPNEPAKLAERAIAPGEAAEPGVTVKNSIEPAKLATDLWSLRYVESAWSIRGYFEVSSVAHFVGSEPF
jgi:hypothetical protein